MSRLAQLLQLIELWTQVSGTAAEFRRLLTLKMGSNGDVICIQLNQTKPMRLIGAISVDEGGFAFQDNRFTSIPSGVHEASLSACHLLERLDALRLYAAASTATKEAALAAVQEVMA